MVLNQSDLLVVVWDGERRDKRGGTEEILDIARSRGVRVAWINSENPWNWALLDATTPLPQYAGPRLPPAEAGSVDALRDVVREVLELPKPYEFANGNAHDTED